MFGSNNNNNRGVGGKIRNNAISSGGSARGNQVSDVSQRPGLKSNNSEMGSTASSMFSHNQAEAPSTLGGATSVSSGNNSPGKERKAGFGIRVDNIDENGHNGGGATLGSIANEMIDGRRSGNRARNDTLYEDAREETGMSPSAGVGMSGGADMNSSSRGTQGSSIPTRPTMDHQNQSSQKKGRDHDTGRNATSSPGSNKSKNNGRNQQQQQQSASGHQDARHQQTQPTSGGMQLNISQQASQQAGEHTSSPGANHRASIVTTDSRFGAGAGNASHFEQTDAASFFGQDPIAQASDFNREDADTIFLSSEMGNGNNRQPMTRFRVHSVNLNVHSPVLSEMVDDLPESETEVRLEEDAATLKLLFGLMYNSSAPSLGMNEWQVVLRLARCAQKYDVGRAKEVSAAYFTEQEQLGALSPFMTYAFAVQYKLPALEEAAAERSVRYDIHRLPELVFNMMGFAAFQQLASFHTRRQSHYQDVLYNISIDPKELADQCYQTGGVCVIAPWNRLKQKLAWPRQAGRDGSKRPPEPADVIRKLVTEIGQIDCGTCSRALVEAALQAQLALESMPPYSDKEEAF